MGKVVLGQVSVHLRQYHSHSFPFLHIQSHQLTTLLNVTFKTTVCCMMFGTNETILPVNSFT